MKIKLGKILPLAVTTCVLAGTLSGCTIGEKIDDYLAKNKVSHIGLEDDATNIEQTVEEEERYTSDFWREAVPVQEQEIVLPEIQNVEDSYLMDENSFTRELGDRTGARIYITNDELPKLSKKVSTRRLTSTNDVLDSREEYMVNGKVVYSYYYEYFKVYKNNETQETYMFRLNDEVPYDIVNNCEYLGIQKNENKNTTIVEGSDTTIFDLDYADDVSIISSVPVSRDEFFHFLEYEDEFVQNYFGGRPYDYSDAVSMQDPSCDYRYVYATEVDRNGNLVDSENLYLCDNQTYYGEGYYYPSETTYTEGIYSGSDYVYTR